MPILAAATQSPFCPIKLLLLLPALAKMQAGIMAFIAVVRLFWRFLDAWAIVIHVVLH